MATEPEILISRIIEVKEIMLNDKKITLECVVLINGEHFSEPFPTNILLSLDYFKKILASISNKNALDILVEMENYKSTKRKTIKLSEHLNINQSIKFQPFYLSDGFLLFLEVIETEGKKKKK